MDKNNPQVRFLIMLKRIVENLYPHRQIMMMTLISIITASEMTPTITEEYLIASGKKIEDNQAPKPDGVPNEALKAAIHKRTHLFMKTMQKCLEEGVFHDHWKLQQLVQLPKGNEPPKDPSSYWPICLVDTNLQRVIYNRLLSSVEEKWGLSKQQFRYHKNGNRHTIRGLRRIEMPTGQKEMLRSSNTGLIRLRL